MVHDSPLVRSLVLGLTAFRAACLVWLVAVLLATRDDVANVAAGVVLVGAATLVTIVWAYRLRAEGAPSLLGRVPLAVDVAVATALSVGDGIVYDGPHPLSLGSAWPLVAECRTEPRHRLIPHRRTRAAVTPDGGWGRG